jgi:hypothetical protein
MVEEQAKFATCFHAGFLFGLLFGLEHGFDAFIPKRQLTFNKRQGVVS